VKASAVVVMGLALVLLTVSTNSRSLSDRTRWVLLLSLIASIAAALPHQGALLVDEKSWRDPACPGRCRIIQMMWSGWAAGTAHAPGSIPAPS
jgi:4-amino-4-deoxy-L-arabinose transferase-like glycosyltransferase